MSATAFADQVAAATRDAREFVEHVSADPRVAEQFHRADAEPGPFARQVLATIRRDGKRGRLRRCRHLSGRGPSPSWVFGWRPGRLYCHACAAVELTLTRKTTEDDTCDVCREVFPKLWAIVGAAGPFLMSFGACANCFTAETGREVR